MTHGPKFPTLNLGNGSGREGGPRIVVLPDWSIKFGPDKFYFRPVMLGRHMPTDDKFFTYAHRLHDDVQRDLKTWQMLQNCDHDRYRHRPVGQPAQVVGKLCNLKSKTRIIVASDANKSSRTIHPQITADRIVLLNFLSLAAAEIQNRPAGDRMGDCFRRWVTISVHEALRLIVRHIRKWLQSPRGPLLSSSPRNHPASSPSGASASHADQDPSNPRSAPEIHSACRRLSSVPPRMPQQELHWPRLGPYAQYNRAYEQDRQNIAVSHSLPWPL